MPGKSTKEVRARAARIEARLEGLADDDHVLYAVVDAAREASIADLMRAAGDHAASYFRGPRGRQLARVAPYLVDLERAPDVLDALTHGGWDAGWATVLLSGLDLDVLLAHLRRFHVVESPHGEPVYLRLHDPEVLAVFLREATPIERAWFANGIGAIALPDAAATDGVRVEAPTPGQPMPRGELYAPSAGLWAALLRQSGWRTS